MASPWIGLLRGVIGDENGKWSEPKSRNHWTDEAELAYERRLKLARLMYERAEAQGHRDAGN